MDEELYAERALFERISQSDEAAFAELFYRYLPKMQVVIRKITGSEEVTNDIIQDIFLNIWINRERLSTIIAPDKWMYRIMYNRSLTWAERHSVHKKIERSVNREASANSTEEAVAFAETARLVREAVNLLPAQTKKIYRMSRESGLKIPEIALELGVSPNTVKNTLVRAAKSIRDYLVEHGIVVPLVLFLYTKIF